ncbi:uncharacterized protein RAG0_03154 [Rhynchosporium agropyri]|uniref:Uncharacterized protein n=1 Tax=Rhynchosporium agropyri TaxID=914238 RepID=A0A1E1K7G3_9HELO|nr:uncharacterized protein RAG0_03154 [Rhynchosporium agropyri]
MTFRICITSTSKAKHPSETTAIQEMTVTYSTIKNHVETVNEAFSTTYIAEGWPGQAPKQEVDANFPSKQRKRKSTEGLEEEITTFDGPFYCYLWELDSESWTYKLSASNWSESVYHLKYLRADGTPSEREVRAEALTESLSEHDLETPVDLDFARSVTNTSTDQQRRCELLGNERILDDATWQLEEMLSGMSNTKVIASQILSRLDFAKITLLACTIVVGQCSSEYWSKRKQKAFRRKFNDAVNLSWSLDDVLGAWEQLLEVSQDTE